MTTINGLGYVSVDGGNHTKRPKAPDGTEQDIFDTMDLDVLPDALSFPIRSLNLWVSRFLEKELAGSPLAGGTGRITTLIMVFKQPGITAAEIAPFAGKDAPAMTRLVNRLIENALLERRTDPVRRRRQLLFITPKGEEQVEKLRAVLKRERAEAFGMLSDEEHAEVVRILRKATSAYICRLDKTDPDWGAS